MSEEISFEDETDTKKDEAPKAEEALADVNKRLEALEKRVSGVLSFIEKMQKKQTLQDEAEAKKTAEAETPPVAEEVKEEVAEVKESVEDVKKETEELKKQIKALEDKPARITESLSQSDNADKRIQQFLSGVTGGEVLVWAEKTNKKWGRGDL